VVFIVNASSAGPSKGARTLSAAFLTRSAYFPQSTLPTLTLATVFSQLRLIEETRVSTVMHLILGCSSRRLLSSHGSTPLVSA
jgi:hypothetical protein